jgi:hypothetical protein
MALASASSVSQQPRLLAEYRAGYLRHAPSMQETSDAYGNQCRACHARRQKGLLFQDDAGSGTATLKAIGIGPRCERTRVRTRISLRHLAQSHYHPGLRVAQSSFPLMDLMIRGIHCNGTTHFHSDHLGFPKSREPTHLHLGHTLAP